MNFYTTVDAVKTVLNASGTALDARLFEHLGEASRRIEQFAGRVFWTEIGSRYFDGRCGSRLYLDDFLSVSAVVVDSEQDNTFDGETWVDGTDFVIWPDNTWPKLGLLALPNGNYAWRDLERNIKVTGTWGYGDGKGASAWSTAAVAGTAITATVATAGGVTLTLSADGAVEVGHTLLIDDEQLFVTAVGTGEVTVVRGVNGTTAASHAAAGVGIAQYPEAVKHAAATLAIALLARNPKAGYVSERIGDYQYTLATAEQEEAFLGRALYGLVKVVA